MVNTYVFKKHYATIAELVIKVAEAIFFTMLS